MLRQALAGLAVALVCATSPQAQTRAERVLFDYETEQLGPGIYAFIAPESKTPFVSGNSVVVIGDDGVLVVDSSNVPSLARRMIGDIRRWTNKPVRVLVNTHWHPDHLMGNAAYKDAFPDVAIVATEAMREVARTQVPAYFEQTLGPAGTATVDALRKVIATGKKPNGTDVSSADREFLELELADFEAWVRDAKGTAYVAPTVTFDRELTVWLGKREVRLLHLGRGNTAGDAIVYVPDAKTVATGDLLVGPTPYATASFLREWIGVMDKLTALDAVSIAPGHGPVEHDWGHARVVRRLLQSVVEQVDAAVGKGLSLDDTRKQIDVSTFREQMTGGDSFRERAFDNFFLPGAIERTYREATYLAEK